MKTVLKITTVLVLLFGSFAFGQIQTNPDAEIIEKLSKDSDFIALGEEYVNFFTNMPQKESFVNRYKDEEFKTLGETYFLNITGYQDLQVKTFVNKINDLYFRLYEKFPELKYNGNNEKYISEIITKAIAYQVSSSRMTCDQCVKKWKPRMVQLTIVGGIVGFASGGGFGAWGGAVLGFAGAGWALVDCLEDAGC